MNWQNKIAEQVGSIPRSGIREFFDLVTGRSDIISLGVGEPDFVTPWNIREAAIYSLEKGHTSYTSNYGLESLRRSIVKYVRGFFHVDYNPLNEVLVTVGVSEAIDLALRAVLNPGDEVLYHEPCYVSYAPSVRRLTEWLPPCLRASRISSPSILPCWKPPSPPEPRC